tara:strand:+ start:577 stop:759 length:183 start_codon:yes stop_codon:yes gene_type:complete
MNDTAKDLFEQIVEQYEVFVAEHAAHQGGNKAAGRRARKAAGEIKKLITPYKKESVAGDK